MPIPRSTYILRQALLGGPLKRPPSPSAPHNVLPRRNLASSSTRQLDDEHEMKKWEKITYAGIATCTVLAIYNLSKGHHPKVEEPQKPYPYLRIRHKDFPWGPDSLFETIKKKRHSHD
ncbi:hypothetical protein MLD38_028511 [Melastoma candidum]|uniref:Uncharacterized protein n=1 Tax=Melastoma candidum TaxID=119954 RepID=A0ACB9N173_9MYRT|nr:hypothetical protein MLD38_028511 [Melastoma candidum]